MAARSFAEEISRHSGDLTPIPFDRHMCPINNSFLENMTDQEILDVPPHVMIHALRTAAQSGAQVISPRQIPSSYMLGRTRNNASQPFLHMTGCESNNRFKWPVPDGHSPLNPTHLEDRTVVKHGNPLSKRSPATASPLTYASAHISNPIHKKILKAKANIDFQNREDVRGDPDALAVNYAKVWGQVDGTFARMGTVTLAHLTDLQRHAIAPDTAFARYLGPIHERRVITTAVGPSNSSAFGEFYGVDWTAMRVCADTKFALAVNTEGYSLREMALPFSVSEYSCDDRPTTMMVFHPKPGVAWCYAPNTFRVRPANLMKKARTPPVLRVELATNAGMAKVGDLMRVYTAAVTWTRTQEARVAETPNPLTSGMSVIARAVSRTSSVGKTVHKHARTVFMDALTTAPIDSRRMFGRTMSVLVKVVRAINDGNSQPHVVDSVARYVGKRFQLLDGSLNARMITGASSRGKNHEDSFCSFRSQAPRAFRDISCNSYGWSCLVARFVLHPPDDKWRKYAASLTAIGIQAMEDIMTPIPSIPSDDAADTRQIISVHCSTVARNKGDMYGSSYAGVARAAFALATVYDDYEIHELWRMFRISGFLWMFRSRCAETVKVHICDEDTPVPTHGAFRIHEFGEPLGRKKVVATIAPYIHFRALAKGLKRLGLLPDVDPDAELIGRVTDHITGWGTLWDYDMAVDWFGEYADEEVRESGVARYLIDIGDLARDVERFLSYAINDCINAASSVIRNVELNREAARRAALPAPEAMADAARQAIGEVGAAIGAAFNNDVDNIAHDDYGTDEMKGIDYLDTVDEDEAILILDEYTSDNAVAVALLEAPYADAQAFHNAFVQYIRESRAEPTALNALRG